MSCNGCGRPVNTPRPYPEPHYVAGATSIAAKTYTAEVIVRLRGTGHEGQEHVVELSIASNRTYEQIVRVAHSRKDGAVPELENACCDEELLDHARRLREAEARLAALCTSPAEARND